MKNMTSLFLTLCLIKGLNCFENITKREGETVVLHVKEPQEPMNYLWMYTAPDAPTVALVTVTNNVPSLVNGTRFSSRLGLDSSSGSITISNLSISDSGTFQIQINGETRTMTLHYNLTVNGNHIVVAALLGSYMTLSSKATHLDPAHHHVIWTMNDFKGKQIATWEKNVITYDPELREHLLLDSENGSLTIHNITAQLAAFYCVRTMFGKDPYFLIRYEVEVYNKVSSLHLSTPEMNLSPVPWSCRVNCSVNNSEDVTLTLYKGNTVLSERSDSNLAITLVLTLDVPQNSSKDTFTCEVANPISKNTVVFNTTYWCPQHDSQTDHKTWYIVGALIALIVLAAIVVVSVKVQKTFCCQRLKDENTSEPSADTPLDSESNDLIQN